MENYMAKAADAFLTGRPYGIRLDFKHKGFALFNYNMNELGNHLSRQTGNASAGGF